MARLHFFLNIVQIIAPLVWGAITGIVGIMFVGLSTFFKSMWDSIDVIANNILERAMYSGKVPSLWSPTLYWIFKIVAFFTVLAMWIIIAHLTVWICSLRPR